jgi:hypothetical protein
VLIHLLAVLLERAERARTNNQRRAVWKHAQMVNRAGPDLPEPQDRRDTCPTPGRREAPAAGAKVPGWKLSGPAKARPCQAVRTRLKACSTNSLKTA